MNIEIFKPSIDDAKKMIEVLDSTWITTYRDLIPDSILSYRISIREDRLKEMSENILKNNNYFVARYNDEIIGLVEYGKSRNSDYKDYGEIYSLYVLEEYQGISAGKRLFFKAIKELIEMNYKNMLLNVLVGNKAVNFYEKFDGKIVGKRQDDYDGNIVTENIMIFKDLSNLYKLKVGETDDRN